MNRLTKLLIVSVSVPVVLFLLLGSVLGRDTSSESVYRHFDVFTEVLTRIKSEYVEEPDMKNVTLGALNGLLEAIDPFASYLSEDQYRQYLESKKKHNPGVGLVLSRKVGYVSVVDAIPGSPAARAGLTTGDMIETIGGVATRDMPLAYAELLLRGKPGTEVELTLLRVRQGTEPQKFRLRREPLQYPEVSARMLRPGLGYIKVQSMEPGKTAAIGRRLRKLMRQGAKQIILDLRRSATGKPEEGLAVADLFLDEGLMAYVEGQRYPRQDFTAERRKTVSRLPMVVVINRGTAQGAELTAAALLSNKRCEVVGERSYGDAAVRRAVKLPDGGAVILSVAKYYTPDGKAIQDTGVTPTVVSIAREPVAESETGGEPKIGPRPELPIDKDTILQKAIEVLTQPQKKVARNLPLEPDLNQDPLLRTPLGVPRRH